MTTWVLVLYLSTGFAQSATGGPLTIDGFSSAELCRSANEQFSKELKKYDWGQCLEVKK
jgi:hypothetical protein